MAQHKRPAASAASYDIIVVGAGVVGSALSYALGRSGRRVAMIERDLSEPDRIVGELLQPGGVRALNLMGIQDALEGIDAVPVHGYQVFYGQRTVPIPYPLENDGSKGKGIRSTSGHVEGRSFHHGRFVQALRRKAMAQERVTTIEATVRELVEDASGRVIGVLATPKAQPTVSNGTLASAPPSTVDTAAGPSASKPCEPSSLRLTAPLTIVVDGCFSKFRRTHGSSIAPVVRSHFVGYELQHAPLPSPNYGHVVLGPAGPTLLYQISSEHTRILMDVAGDRLPSAAKGDLQRHIRERVIPYVPAQLRDCILKELDGGQRIRSMPNSFLPPSMQGQSKHRSGVMLVGDAMNMRHPLTGGGMTVGLWDAVHLTAVLGGGLWSPQRNPTEYENDVKDLSDWSALRPALKQWHWRRKGLASVINILAQALYSLFGADDQYLEVLREGCFEYFELGGDCVGGPVSLLSGLAPEPSLLIYHFFRVAFFSIWVMFTRPHYYAAEQVTRKPSVLEWPALMLKAVMVFYTACVVLLPVIFTEMRANQPRFQASKSPAARVAAAAKAASATARSAVSPAAKSATASHARKTSTGVRLATSSPKAGSSSAVTTGVQSSSSSSSATAARVSPPTTGDEGLLNNGIVVCALAAGAAYAYSAHHSGSIFPRSLAFAAEKAREHASS